MSRNEDIYGAEVDKFRPERFLETNRRDPALFVFGFGRRYTTLYPIPLTLYLITNIPGFVREDT